MFLRWEVNHGFTLKVYYSAEIRVWIRNNNKALTSYNILELFGRAYMTVRTDGITANSFWVIKSLSWNKTAEQNAVKDGRTDTPIKSLSNHKAPSNNNFRSPLLSTIFDLQSQ